MKTRNIFEVGNNVVEVKIVNADYLKGETPKELEVFGEFTFDLKDVPTELLDGETVRTLAAYGLSSLMQDRCSGLNDKALMEMGVVSGKEAAKARLEGYQAVFDHLNEGLFKVARAAATGKAASVDAYFATGFSMYLESKGKSVDVATATTLLQGMGADERKAVRAHAEVAPFIVKARADAAQAASEIDLASLLG